MKRCDAGWAAWLWVVCAAGPACTVQPPQTTGGGFQIVLDVAVDGGAADAMGYGGGDPADAEAAEDSATDEDAAAFAETGDDAVAIEDAVTLEDTAASDDAAAGDAVADASKPDIYKPDVVLADIKADAKADTKPGDSGGAQVTFAQLWAGPLKTAGCLSPACHGTLFPNQSEGLKNLLSGKGEGDCGGKPLVVPGDAVASLLWQKVQPGLATCGLKMPPGAPSPGGMAAKDAALIEAWIEGGAKP